MDTAVTAVAAVAGVVPAVDELDPAELIAFPHLIAGGHVLLAEAGARRAAVAVPPAETPAARGAAPDRAARRWRQLRLRRTWREPLGAAVSAA